MMAALQYVPFVTPRITKNLVLALNDLNVKLYNDKSTNTVIKNQHNKHLVGYVNVWVLNIHKFNNLYFMYAYNMLGCIASPMCYNAGKDKFNLSVWLTFFITNITDKYSSYIILIFYDRPTNVVGTEIDDIITYNVKYDLSRLKALIIYPDISEVESVDFCKVFTEYKKLCNDSLQNLSMHDMLLLRLPKPPELYSLFRLWENIPFISVYPKTMMDKIVVSPIPLVIQQEPQCISCDCKKMSNYSKNIQYFYYCLECLINNSSCSSSALVKNSDINKYTIAYDCKYKMNSMLN